MFFLTFLLFFQNFTFYITLKRNKKKERNEETKRKPDTTNTEVSRSQLLKRTKKLYPGYSEDHQES